jgi:hypothetical protein
VPTPLAEAAPKAETTTAPKPEEKPAPEDGSEAEPTLKPESAVFTPMRPPDDPGVAPTDSDENPMSLERLRAAQIR